MHGRSSLLLKSTSLGRLRVALLTVLHLPDGLCLKGVVLLTFSGPMQLLGLSSFGQGLSDKGPFIEHIGCVKVVMVEVRIYFFQLELEGARVVGHG